MPPRENMIANSTAKNALIIAIVSKSVANGCRLVVDNALYTIAPNIISKNKAVIRGIKLLRITNNYNIGKCHNL